MNCILVSNNELQKRMQVESLCSDNLLLFFLLLWSGSSSGFDRLAEICIELSLCSFSKHLGWQRPICLTDHIDSGVIVILTTWHDKFILLEAEEADV